MHMRRSITVGLKGDTARRRTPRQAVLDQAVKPVLNLVDIANSHSHYPVRARRIHALFVRLPEQLLRELLLIDDLPSHRMDHLGRAHQSLILPVRPTQKHGWRTREPAVFCQILTRGHLRR